jgi:Domain of unknown function (DUF4157)
MAMRLSQKRSDTSTPQTSTLSQYARPFVVQRQGQEETVGAAPEKGVSLLNNRYQVSATPEYQPGWIARVQAASQPRGLGVQAKLTIGQPNDRYEQEADRVAEQVMGMPDAKPAVQREGMPGEELQTKSLGRAIQREVMPEEEEVQAKPLSATITPLVQREVMPEEEEEVQAKSLGGEIQREAVPEEEEEPIQAKLIQREAMEEEEIQAKRSSGGELEAGGDFESRLGSSKSGGSPLPEDVRSFMEPRFGADFSGVRVHTGSEAVRMNREVGAQAFAHGQDVYYGAGKGPGKDALTAHELTHVVQQSGRTAASDVSKSATTQTTRISAEVIPGMVQRDMLPVAKFSPSPGLFIERTENSVTISGAMELYGSQANASRAASIQTSINTTWTKIFPDGHSVSCNITVAYRGKGSKPGNATQIETDNTLGPSHVLYGLNARSMTLNSNESGAFTWTPAHEFGHIIGLDDRYSEGIISKVKGLFGRERTTTTQSGYEGNLMAVHGGALESKNVQDIAKENEPSAYWINDDDQVRDWVNGHSFSDIGKLSTNNKLKAIKTLMGGWISDDDVAAITRICSSVTSSNEANTIRSGVNILGMTSTGQRTMVRLAFSNMP